MATSVYKVLKISPFSSFIIYMVSIKAKAFALLAKKAYFSKQLRKKLLEKGYPGDEVEGLIKEFTCHSLCRAAEAKGVRDPADCVEASRKGG